MTSIYDVAAAAGVSITTVSHVFSGKRHVAPETAARVIETAQALNYSPQLSARALATGRSMILGVCFPAETDVLHRNPYFPALLEGLSAAAAEAGYGFLLIPTRFNADDLARTNMINKLDGVIVADPTEADERLQAFLASDLPIITIGRWIGREDIAWVDNDHRAGIVQLFGHLAKEGYSRPLLLTKESSVSYEADVEAAFRSETSARGLEGKVEWCGNLFNQETYELARRLLDVAAPPDVIIASTDSLALSVLQAATDLGIAVPDELGVVGEGETMLSASANPPLTTIRVYPDQLGSRAVALLLKELAGEAGPRQISIDAELVVRASTCRRKKTARPG